MKKVKMVKGKQEVEIYECEVKAYTKDGWKKKPAKKSTKQED